MDNNPDINEPDIKALGEMTQAQRAEVLNRARWVKVPSKNPHVMIEALYSKMGEQNMMFGLLSASPQQTQIQYVTKPIGKRVCLIFDPRILERDVKATFSLMLQMGLVAAVFLEAHEAPSLPSIIQFTH